MSDADCTPIREPRSVAASFYSKVTLISGTHMFQIDPLISSVYFRPTFVDLQELTLP